MSEGPLPRPGADGSVLLEAEGDLRRSSGDRFRSPGRGQPLGHDPCSSGLSSDPDSVKTAGIVSKSV